MQPVCWKIIVTVAFALFLFPLSCRTSHPSDGDLEQNFRMHQADFDKLVRMLTEDEDIVRIIDGHVYFHEVSNRQLPQGRLNEYESLFRKLKIEGGFHRSGGKIRLIASTRGLALPNSEKSYVYTPQVPGPLVGSLDEVINKNHGDQAPVFRRLNGNWYLYYESW